jgi:hypothetical protein
MEYKEGATLHLEEKVNNSRYQNRAPLQIVTCILGHRGQGHARNYDSQQSLNNKSFVNPSHQSLLPHNTFGFTEKVSKRQENQDG